MKTILRATLALIALAMIFSTYSFAEAPATFKQCAMCHGANGEGKAAMKTADFASADVQKQSDADLTGIITNGKEKMPAYKGKLTDAQIGDLVKWIRTLKK
ncbi:MAG: cytochrome c [Terriglobales bacterium]|jgi:mono/diheme cytochrome c family protein